MTDDHASTDAFARRAVEAAVRVGLIALLLVVCWTIVRPFYTPVVWGAILAVAVHPGFRALSDRIGGHDRWTAALLTLLGLAIIVGPIGMVVSVLWDNLQALGTQLSAGTLHVPPPPEAVAGWPLIGEPLHRLWSLASTNLEAALQEIGPQLQVVSGWLLTLAAGLGLGFLQFIVALVIAGVLLANADICHRAALAILGRVAGVRGAGLVELATRTVRNVTRGILGTALIQATLAGIGMVAVGVPGAGLLALIAFVLAALGIGAGLVLIPAMIYVFATGELWIGMLFAVWSVPVMLVDNVLKPILMGRGASVPILVIFVGVVGGTLAFGIIGLFIGPVVLALGYELGVAWIRMGVEDDPAANDRPAIES
jgi:predicted PurR-regulated permease PerM